MAILPAATDDLHLNRDVPYGRKAKVIKLQALEKSSLKQNLAYEPHTMLLEEFILQANRKKEGLWTQYLVLGKTP